MYRIQEKPEGESQELDQTILTALFKSQHLSPPEQLSLTLTWNRVSYIFCFFFPLLLPLLCSNWQFSRNARLNRHTYIYFQTHTHTHLHTRTQTGGHRTEWNLCIRPGMAARCTWRCYDASTWTWSYWFCEIAFGKWCIDEKIPHHTTAWGALQHAPRSTKYARVIHCWFCFCFCFCFRRYR